MSASLQSQYLFSVVLVLIQALAAVPWLIVLNREGLRSRTKRQGGRAPGVGTWLRWAAYGLAGVLGAAVALTALLTGQVHETLQGYGGVYGLILHIQLVVDAFIVCFGVLLTVWPKGAAVALAAFREGWRQPMFWLLLVLALVLMVVTPFLPYFTFGEDFKMVKELGYDTIMLFSALFGVLAASMSISEEIEGRTAVTLMSKPVSRRQFLIGKYVGILLSALMMASVLSFAFYGIMLMRIDRDALPVPVGLEETAKAWTGRIGENPAYFLYGIGYWIGHVTSLIAGVVLGACQVMVLLAIAVALATRLPMIVNLVICLVIFFLGHLAPILEQLSQSRYELVHFMAQLFARLLPGLDLFSLGAVIARDTPPPAAPFAAYVGMVTLYAVLYSTIALLFGLILFEDRDLA
jgi:magnesium-transporting ATPase (P-type)